ncbi:gas vesicle protein GvpU [Salipaludibacillus keqinensis]|uniref:Gas vesicle protein GvpU n=1 Tax=Salipaludibacillus keqinensis TaxID=2045207 RepID=A0A323TLK1_9BACI|nr:gas vesicle accessory protein GvpU [Salipaludibacillus keqinensis]PYZ94627.1 gas vesicle protein GvpU [Salipaludibacillus keqinensis]
MSDKPMNTDVDTVLQLLIETANTKNYSFDITLNVKGTVVTGTVIAAKDYLEKLSKEFSQEDEVEKEINDKLQSAVDALEEEEEPSANYVHLEEAKLFSESGKSLPSEGSVLWRGKLNDVDGFFLGKVTAD